MRALHGTRLVVLFALAIVFAGSLYADSEKPPHGMGKYVIVLWEPGTPVPGHPDERMRRVEKPDVAKAGGRVLSQQVNRMVVYLPFAAAKQLQRHEAVSYIQRIWMGEPFSEWDEDAAATQLRAGNIAANEDPNFTWSKSYSYDADGNITHIGNDSFNYDALQRLTQATVNGSTESYTYDAFGNLTNIASTSGSTAIPTDPGSNRMTGETYDAAGNVTSAKNGARYEFDSMHMMVRYDGAVSGSRRMLYDANDERIGTIVDGSLQRWTIRDFDGQILREFRSNGMSESWIWEQDHIRGEGQLIAGETQRWNYYWEGSNFSYGGHRHYHLDHLGSVRLVTNAAGRTLSENEFYPFGKSQSRQFQEQINGGDPHTDGMRFAGHWRDNLGFPGIEDDNYLDVMHARTYDPNLGRFLSVDPVLDINQATRNPQGWNRYAYVFNNPLRFSDPTGKYVCQGKEQACKTVEATLGVMKKAAAGLKSNDPRKAQLNRVIAAYGKPGDAKTKISTVWANPTKPDGSPLLKPGQLGQAGIDGNVFLSLKNVTAKAGGSGDKAFLILGGTMTHEGQHELQPAVVGLPVGARPSMLSMVFNERQAYVVEQGYYQGLGEGAMAPDPTIGAFASAAAGCGSPQGCDP